MLTNMFRNRYVLCGIIFVVLILANIIVQIYDNWGLITVKVTDAPLGKVIKSIEWQGWVKICTNVPLDTKVSIYVDHVPLAEAMETLAANVSLPPADNAGAPGGGGPPGAQAGGQGGGNSAAPGNGGPRLGGGGNGGDNGGGRGRRNGGGGDGQGGAPGGGGRGGFERNATWNLAFFVAPTSAAVKEEINDFQADILDDDSKIYNFPTPLQMEATDDEMPAADPRRQSWPGMTPALSAPLPAPRANRNGGNGTPPPGGGPAVTQDDPPADDGPPTVQTYLQALARSADIWILAPGAWAPTVTTPPPANSSIARAVRNLVNNARGAVTEVIVLRVGHGGRGGGRGGMFADMEATEERMDNAISGLPPEYQAAVRTQLQSDVKTMRDIMLAPEDQRPQMFRDFMQKHRGNGNNWRLSPEKRAERYARMVANRETAQGKK